MTTSILYASTDVGAPVLNNVNGSLNAVLKACLVDGYGDKDPLGWTMPFTEPGSFINVYKNDPVKGTGCYLRVMDTDATANEYNLRMYSSMSDANTGIDPMPRIAYSIGMRTTGASMDVGRKWMVIGDKQGFYLLVFPHADSTAIKDVAFVTYIGDVISYIPQCDKLYALFGNEGANGHFGTLCNDTEASLNMVNNFCMISKDPVTMLFGACSVQLRQNYGFSRNTTGYRAGCFEGEVPEINGIPYCTDADIVISNSISVGRLPGLLLPIYRMGTTMQADRIPPKYFMSNGKLYLRVVLAPESQSSAVTSNSIIMILIGSGFRP